MANGWTPERRAKQAALIQTWKPWERSTGPKTEAGKEMSSMNALRHGLWSAEAIEQQRGIRDLMRSFRDCRMEVLR